jgi:hypothetical protein
MLVAIAVSLVFVGGMLLSRGDFDSTVRLGSIAREVALVVRQAQTTGSGGGSGGSPYGIYLEQSSTAEVRLYAEDNGSSGYDGPTSDNVQETLMLPDQYSISSFCISNNTSTEDCSGSVTKPNDLSIYFVRPSLKANFQSDSTTASTSQRAIIDITHDSTGNTRSVVVDSTGYITVP